MADIELVIKIDEEEYKNAKSINWANMRPEVVDDWEYIVANGTPLPRFHGRLGDLDALREEVSSWGMNDYEPSDFTDEIDRTPTIIESDRSE